MQVMDEMIAIFAEMGFAVAEGPDIEDDFHNFTGLNFPPSHPAREMHDTFFFDDRRRRRAQAAAHPHQPDPGAGDAADQRAARRAAVRLAARSRRSASSARAAPIAATSDRTHTPMFHQMEGLVIDRNIHMGHLKWTLDAFCRRFFETDAVVTRFRPHHFPFTEPSAEMDVQCDRSGGAVKIGEGTDWLEILGGGMVHPNILRICGLDPDEWQGFAFGIGIDRLGMLKYGMPDLRDVFAADIRWLAPLRLLGLRRAPNLATGLS